MIIRLFKSGCTYKEISKKAMCTPRTISKIVEKYNEECYGIQSDVYEQVSDMALEIGVEVEDLLIGIMQENEYWGLNTRTHSDEVKKKKISELNSAILNTFLQMSKDLGTSPEEILTEMLNKYHNLRD